MKLHKQVKANGRRCLYNNWGKAVAIALLQLAIYLLFALLELILSLIFGSSRMLEGGYLPGTTLLSMLLTLILAVGGFLIDSPLKLGITQWYYGLSEGRSDEVLNIFSFFSGWKSYFRALLLQVNIWGRKLILGIFYFLLPALTGAASVWCLDFGDRYLSSDLSYVLGSMGLLFSLLLALLLGVCYAIAVQRFFLAPYYVANEDMGVWEALKKSRHASRDKRGEIFLFKLSWLPWFLSCLLVIPAIYAVPCYKMSAMLYARVLMEQHCRSTQIVPLDPETEEEEPDGAERPDLDKTQVFEAPNEK